MKCFKGVTIYVEGEGLKKCSLVFDDKIRKISRCADKHAECISLPENAIVLPGFIDQHIHGAGGSDGMDGTVEDIAKIASMLAGEGTTSFLVTTMTQSKENIMKAMRAIREYKEAQPQTGARVLGAHLEGPFIAEAYKGAQPLAYIKAPDIETFEEYNQESGNAIKLVSLAPEVDGAKQFIEYLSNHAIVASLGHTAAKFEDMCTAVALGAKNVTHTYNAQTPVNHRDIGAVGGAMLLDELNCELIADTIHVTVPAMRLLIKNKPLDKISLITDAMRAKGLSDGESELGGQKVYVKNGEARLENGTLAGSVLRMNRALQNVVEKVGVPFTQAVDYATINPAKLLGVDSETGSIKVGKRADFTVIDADYNVLMTIRDGNIIYQAE